MNVYDFDGTIYDGDSSIDFYLFSLRKNIKIIKYLPKQIKAIILYKLKKIDKTMMKETFFSFLKDINVEEYLSEFWTKHEKNIKKWYLDKKEDDDVIISASPEFLLEPICKKLNIKKLIASKVNKLNGKFEGANCKGEKKVEFFREKIKDKEINNFYSDSKSDQPLADISKKAYFVKGNKIIDWKDKKTCNYLSNLYSNFLFVLSAFIFNYAAANAPTELNAIFKYSTTKTVIIATLMAAIYGATHENLFNYFKEKKLINKLITIMATIGTCKFYTNVLQMQQPINIFDMFIFNPTGIYYKLFYITIACLMAPFCIILFSKIYSYIGKIFSSVFEKITFKEIIAMSVTFVFLIVLMIITFSRSNLFYNYLYPLYDVVYTSDTLHLLLDNAWMNGIHAENDLRQPLFAAFAAPFVAPLYSITAWFENVSPMVLALTIGIANILLIIISAYMLAKLIEGKKHNIGFFLLYMSTFAPLLFSIMLEQYTVSLFWLIALLYMYINKIEDRKLSYLGATGSLLTTGVTFPLIYDKEDRILTKLKKIFNAFFYSTFVLLLLGRIDVIMKFPLKINSLLGFAGTKLSYLEKFQQYTHFIVNCFVSINGEAKISAWGLKEITNINLLGVIIFILVTVSFILNKKDKLSKISYYWVIFSVAILCIVGWGTKENGLILYSLYFSWAFVILLYNLMKYIFNKFKIDKYFKYFILALTIIILIFNLYNINEMVTYISQIKV